MNVGSVAVVVSELTLALARAAVSVAGVAGVVAGLRTDHRNWCCGHSGCCRHHRRQVVIAAMVAVVAVIVTGIAVMVGGVAVVVGAAVNMGRSSNRRVRISWLLGDMSRCLF